MAFLPDEKDYAMPECLSVKIGMQTCLDCKKNPVPTSDQSAIIPKIVVLKACVLNDPLLGVFT